VHSLHFGTATSSYPYGGKTKAHLKKGDRIYVRYEIKNKHQLAFYLAIEHTKKEIVRLYDGAASVSTAGFKLQDIFKMGRDEMWANNVVYDGKISKQ